MAEFYKMNPAKWDNGTAGLNLEQEAAYLRIVNAINKADEPCPARPVVLAGMFRCSTRKAKRLLRELVAAEKVWIEGDRIFNSKAMNDLSDRLELREKRQSAGGEGGRKKAANWPRTGRQLPVDDESTHSSRTVGGVVVTAKPLENNEPTLALATPREEKRREEKSPDTDVSGEPSLGEIIFNQGLAYLVRNGMTEPKARSMLGKWRKTYGEERLLEALRRSQAAGASEPLAFVTGCLKQISGPVEKATASDHIMDDLKRRAGD